MKININKDIYLFIFLTPIIIVQGLIFCKLYISGILSEIFSFNDGIDTFIIFFQALISSIIITFLLKKSTQRIIENEKSGIKLTNIKNDYKAINISIIYVLISLILQFVATKDGVHEYETYLRQWDIINQGLNPWEGTFEARITNAYLPIHNFFAPLASINNLLPKFLFLCIFLIPMYFSSIYPLNLKREMHNISKLKIFLIFAFCPFSVIFTSLYGLNDTLVVGLIVLSLFLSSCDFKKFNSLISGISLALATMVKVYPVFIAPIFIFRKRKFDINFFTSYIFSILVILLTSLSIWGKSTLFPILFATDRHSKHISFFNFFRRVLGYNLDEYSIYAMGLVLLLTLFYIYKNKVDLIPAVTLTLALVLTFYKVGHPQFFLYFFAASPLIIRYLYDKELFKKGRLFGSYLTWICFLNFYQTFYVLGCTISHDFLGNIRGFGSLPYIFFSVSMLFELIKLLKKDPKALSSN